MRRIRKNSIYDVYCISQYLYQRYSNNLFWGCLDSAVGRGRDSAVLGGVAEVVSSNPRWAIKIFSAFSGIVDLLYLSMSIFIINLHQFLILCSSKVLLL